MDNINTSIGQDSNSKFIIGVLDIYGFESFKTNRCLIGMPLFFIIDRVSFGGAWGKQQSACVVDVHGG